MKIILNKNIEKLGFKYEIIEVNPGFAMNYLIPKGVAILANKSKIKHNTEIIRQKYKKKQYILNIAKKTLKKLRNTILIINVTKDIHGNLVNSITNNDISKELAKIDITIANKYIILPRNTINYVGKYIAKIKLHINIETIIRLEII
jgi:large subunit ribosomal protein L9